MRVFTPFDTPSAKNTLRSVSLYRRSESIYRNGGHFALIHIVSRADELSNVKKLALAVFIALLTIFIVIGKKKFDGTSSRLHGFGGRNRDFHSFVYGIYARSDETSRARSLDKAYSARTFRAFAVIESAEGGDFVSASFCCFEYGHTRFDFVRNSFDFNINFSHL